MGFLQYIGAGTKYLFAGTVDSSGNLVSGSSTTAPTAGNSSSMRRIVGIQQAGLAVPDPDIVVVPGDDSVLGNFDFDSDSPNSFTIQKGAFDMTFDALAQGTNVYTLGDVNFGVLRPDDSSYPDICWILQGRISSKDAATAGAQGWGGVIVPRTTVRPLGRDSFNTKTAAADRLFVTAQVATQFPYGVTFNNNTIGADAAPYVPFTASYPMHMVRATGDNTALVVSLPYTPAAADANKVIVVVNGVVQLYTTNYTVSIANKTVNFVTSPATSAVIEILYQFVP